MAPSPRYPAGQPAAAVRPARRNRPGADGGRRPGRTTRRDRPGANGGRCPGRL